MLREAPATRQVEGEPPRRWFSSADMDLIVWEQPPGRLLGFELCYDKGRDEHAVMWWCDRGFTHWQVAEGDRAEGLGHKSTPILLETTRVPWAGLARRLHAAAAALPQPLRDAIVERLRCGA
jgi:hypothetical protein